MKPVILIGVVLLLIFIFFGAQIIPADVSVAGVNLHSAALDTGAGLSTVSLRAVEEVLGKGRGYDATPIRQFPPRPQGQGSAGLGLPSEATQELVLTPAVVSPTPDVDSVTWQLPIRLDEIEFLCATAQDHRSRSQNADLAWDLCAKLGTSVYPVASGVVIFTSQNDEAGFGWWIQVFHPQGEGYISTYAHLGAIFVRVGDQVQVNTVLGRVGSTGSVNSYGPHLHIALEKAGDWEMGRPKRGQSDMLSMDQEFARFRSALRYCRGCNVTPRTLVPDKGLPALTKPREVSVVSTDQKVIALTFDAGSPGLSGSEVVTVLRRYHDELGLNTTVFVAGRWAEANKRQLQDLVQSGFEIGNHSYSHPDLTKLSAVLVREQFTETEETVGQIAGVSTKPLWRAPFGARDANLLATAYSLGWSYHIYWAVDSGDWREDSLGDKENVVGKVLAGVRPGVVVIMHLGGRNTAAALQEIVPALYEQGYQFVSVTELLRMALIPQ